jgi:hypothetical protein
MGRNTMSTITRRQILAGSALSALASGFPAPAIANSDPIKIGYLPALTGPSSSTGIGINVGLRLRAGRSFAAGIVRPLLRYVDADVHGALSVAVHRSRGALEGCVRLH